MVAGRTEQRGSAEWTGGVVIVVLVLQPSVYAVSVEDVVTVDELPNLVLDLKLAEANRTGVLGLWEPVLNVSEGGEQKGGGGLRRGLRWGVLRGCGCVVVDESEEEAEKASEKCNNESSLVYGLAYCEAGERVFDVEAHWWKKVYVGERRKGKGGSCNGFNGFFIKPRREWWCSGGYYSAFFFCFLFGFPFTFTHFYVISFFPCFFRLSFFFYCLVKVYAPSFM